MQSSFFFTQVQSIVLFSLVIGYETDPPAIDLSDNPHDITLGETAMLRCTVVVQGINVYSAWQRNGERYNIINEDPTCDNSTQVHLCHAGN